MDTILYNYIFAWVCIIGLCLGSFYNVVILRSLSGESIVFPASKCPKCNNKLYFWHNIPVLSYILLRGKCYFCKEKISIQYPIIELTTMLLFAFSFYKFELSYKTLFAMIICSTMLIMSVTDIKERILDCNIAIGLGVVGLIYSYFVGNNIIDSILGLVAGIIILEVIARLGYLFVGSRAMGEGDTYVAAALGACFGLHNIIYVLFYSLIGSMLFIIPQFLYHQLKKKQFLTFTMLILFIFSVLLNIIYNENLIFLAVLCITGITLVFSILRNLRSDKAPIYLPYVPAFFIGTLFAIFFSQQF